MAAIEKEMLFMYWLYAVKITVLQILYRMRAGGTNHHLLYIYVLLLMRSSDCESNPGPRTPKYACQVWSKACRWGQRAMACDNCDLWYHTNCLGVQTPVFEYHVQSVSVGFVVRATYLTFTDQYLNRLLWKRRIHSKVWAPWVTLAWGALRTQAHLYIPHPPRIRIVSLNLQNIRAKKANLMNLLDSANPNSVVGTETWLRLDVHDSEFLPPGYVVRSRRDRLDGYGGVIIMTNSKVRRSKHVAKSWISFALDNNAPFSLTGDFNLPDISWSTNTTSGNQNPLGVSNAFLNTFYDSGLQQMVDFPTRNTTMLDLILTNRPSLINRLKPSPGISDHEAIFIDSDVQVKLHWPTWRKIYLCTKEDLYPRAS